MSYNSRLAYEFTRNITGFASTKPPEMPAHIFIPLAVSDVAQELVVSPYASSDFEMEVRRAIDDLAPQLETKIELSELSAGRYPRGL